MKDTIYDHYMAIDWSTKNMAIARMTKKSNKIILIDVPSDIRDEGLLHVCVAITFALVKNFY